MSAGFDLLLDLIHSGTLESWKERNQKALAALFGTRYPKRAEEVVALRAPDMKGSDSGVPYASYIAPSNPESGTYGGMSFVIFPVEGHPCLIGLVIGTQGLAPDEAILGRPGHARKVRAICDWLNHDFGGGGQVAWAKQDPTRTDIRVPDDIQREWSEYDRLFGRYGHVVYGLYKPTADRAGTSAALSAMLDLMFEERGHKPLKESQQDYEAVRSRWFACLMPEFTRDGVLDLLKRRRFVILQGPPGDWKDANGAADSRI